MVLCCSGENDFGRVMSLRHDLQFVSTVSIDCCCYCGARTTTYITVSLLLLLLPLLLFLPHHIDHHPLHLPPVLPVCCGEDQSFRVRKAAAGGFAEVISRFGCRVPDTQSGSPKSQPVCRSTLPESCGQAFQAAVLSCFRDLCMDLGF